MTLGTADKRTMHAIAGALAAEYRMVEKAEQLERVPFRQCRSFGMPFRNVG